MPLTIRPATRADLDLFFPRQARPTMVATVGEVDGIPIGLGGLYTTQGRAYIFLDLKPEGRRYKVALVKQAKRLIEQARRSGHRYVHCAADPDEPAAVRWLSALGFRPTRYGLWKLWLG